MEQFVADLHIHSCFSRATSKKLSPSLLAAWGTLKGVDILATSDFTHPEWLEMLENELEPCSNGLFRLRGDPELSHLVPGVEFSLKSRVRFLLGTEISSIYKKNGKVRKIHNLVYMPSMDRVREFNRKLGQVGNLEADGRPILGLDAHDLLEMVLETDPLAYLVPAHIWTPWFSVFGSKSGFDSLHECFGDLSEHIFALETGLSSDPEMNWLWSELDKYFMVSNSDAHSGENICREANIFQGEPGYEGIYRALRKEGLGHKFLGTLEFYPEEGKYHLDGHRKCGIVMDPRETMACNGICPVCGKKMTIGVLNRILSLADRKEPAKPAGHPGFSSLIPLCEILSEILGTGPKSKKVRSMYFRMLGRFRSELNILRNVPLEDLGRFSGYAAEGVGRMRRNDVFRLPGFDGQYGQIAVFSQKERLAMANGPMFASLEGTRVQKEKKQVLPANDTLASTGDGAEKKDKRELVFNPAQIEAVRKGPGPVLVLAGPGTGKTQTLLGRVHRLLRRGVSPRQILALTFTRKAAQEMKERLAASAGNSAVPQAETLHALAFDYWQKVHNEAPLIISEEEGKKMFSGANPDLKGAQLRSQWAKYCLAREKGESAGEYGDKFAGVKQNRNLVEYSDLLEFWLQELLSGNFIRPFTHVLVDEIQDLSPLQLEVIRNLVSRNGDGFFGIGDPRQSIYSFRGAQKDVRAYLRDIWPDLHVVGLDKNYRSDARILEYSAALFPEDAPLQATVEHAGGIRLFKARSDLQENRWIADRIKELIGGTAHWQADSAECDAQYLAPGDIAVLVRLKALIPGMAGALKRNGIPFSVPEKEVFYREPRIELVLRTVSRMLGISGEDEVLECPERILARGPESVGAYLRDIPPFDALFWEGREFKELKAAYKQHGGWSGLLNAVRLENEMDAVRQKAQKVRIMTMHAAKGLEFEAVFIPALEDGLMPMTGMDMLLGRNDEEHAEVDLEEEKRLLYVALTRAKSRLFLSHAASRKLYGKTLHLHSSRFLEELPDDGILVTASRAHKKRREKVISLLE
ncbi:MAG: UvrD-helicase domain-containing protein [Thermodesulfobacteriota bacterium]